MTNQHPPHVSGTIRPSDLALFDGYLRDPGAGIPWKIRIRIANTLAAIQPDLQRAASEPVACSADHLDMATPECPDCGAFQEATPSSAPASVAEAAKVLLDWWNQEEGSSLDARKVVKVCQGLRSSEEDWVRFDAALRALSEESK